MSKLVHYERRRDDQVGRLSVCLPAADTLLFVVSGQLLHEIAAKMIEHARTLLEGGRRISAFHDWGEVSGYDLTSRVELTRFLLLERSHFAGAHLYTRPGEVGFGVEVANIVLRHKISVHHHRDGFYTALQRHCGVDLSTGLHAC